MKRVIVDGQTRDVPSAFFGTQKAAAVAALPAFRGASVYKAANQNNVNFGTAAAVTWDAEVFDTDNIHSPTTNPSRLIVPAGVSFVELSYSAYMVSVGAGGLTEAWIKKNGADFPGGACETDNSGSTLGVQLSGTTGPIPVVPGDYFELFIHCTDTDLTFAGGNQRSGFSMKVLG